MLPQCLNRGGEASLVRLDRVPELEEELPLSAAACLALHSWEGRGGQVVTVVDPEGSLFRARVTGFDGASGSVVPFEQLPAARREPARIEVYQALPDKERFELILEKLTELGAARIAPFQAARSISLAERDARQKKSHRWPDVVLRAARQCRRPALPELYPMLTWDEALWLGAQADLKLMLLEKDAPWLLREVLDLRPFRIALLVGPEGGFSPEEVEEAQPLGFVPVSLGARILRTETAAIAATAVLQHCFGDFG